MDTIETYNPTTRFSDVVDNYAKYRPGYPEIILKTLHENYNLSLLSD